jgi:hypothetical protein
MIARSSRSTVDASSSRTIRPPTFTLVRSQTRSTRSMRCSTLSSDRPWRCAGLVSGSGRGGRCKTGPTWLALNGRVARARDRRERASAWPPLARAMRSCLNPASAPFKGTASGSCTLLRRAPSGAPQSCPMSRRHSRIGRPQLEPLRRPSAISCVFPRRPLRTQAEPIGSLLRERLLGRLPVIAGAGFEPATFGL